MPTTRVVKTLLDKIDTIVSGITSIKEVHKNPTSNFDNFPASVYFFADYENNFQSTADNEKIYMFKLFVIVNLNQKSKNSFYYNIMPDLIDDVNEAFDSGWSGSDINGHRSWIKVENGNGSLVEQEGGIEGVIEFNISIKLLTTN